MNEERKKKMSFEDKQRFKLFAVALVGIIVGMLI